MIETETKVAEVKITYSPKIKQSERQGITGSRDAERIFREKMPDGVIEHREVMLLMLLNRAQKVLGVAKVSEGGVSGTVADPKIIFQFALKTNASNIILCHNHPSGNLKPSEADRQLTKKLAEGGKVLDIPLLDHIIIIPDSGYLSFADEGLM